MKLKIEDNALRFRVSKIELEEICSGKEISQTTPLPNAGAFNIKIVPGKQTPPLFLNFEENYLSLHIQENLAKRLYSNLPTREALWELQEVGNGVPLEVFFDVDIRTQK